MAIILDTGESLRFDLSASPSTPWSWSLSYDRSGASDSGVTSAVGTIDDGDPAEAIAALDGYQFRQAKILDIAIVNLGNAALTLQVQKFDGTTATVVDQLSVAAGATYHYDPDAVVSVVAVAQVLELRADFSLADIVGLGASTTGDLSVGTLPIGATPISASIFNGGNIATVLTTLTASVGTDGSQINLHAAADVHGVSFGESGPALEDFPYVLAPIDCRVEFTGNANLSTLTGLDDGVTVVIKYTIPE